MCVCVCVMGGCLYVFVCAYVYVCVCVLVCTLDTSNHSTIVLPLSMGLVIVLMRQILYVNLSLNYVFLI